MTFIPGLYRVEVHWKGLVFGSVHDFFSKGVLLRPL